jgi:hypothetical protein
MTTPTEILSNLKKFVFAKCDYDYCGCEMNYAKITDLFICSVCDNFYEFDAKSNNFMSSISIRWENFKEYILNHETPKLALKVFLTKILLQKDYDEQFINDIWHQLKTEGILKWRYIITK